MSIPKVQLQQGEVKNDHQGMMVQQQQQPQQLQQDAEAAYYTWQDQKSFYDSVNTKDKKKNYKFRVMDTRKITEILKSDQYKKDKVDDEKIENKISELKFQERRKVKDRLFDANASILKKDKKSWWRKDSTKMANIKIAMDRVQMLLQTDLQAGNEFRKNDGKLDFQKIGSTIKNEIDTAIAFCDAYLQDPKKQGTGSTATRRYGYVSTCKKMLEKEAETFRILVQPDIELTLIKDQENIHTLRQILSGIKVIHVQNAVNQNQGNSQEVYVVDVNKTDVEGGHVEAMNDNGELVKYYMKENLPMLDKTTDLYLKRRIKELNKGKEFKNSLNKDEQDKEEYRMKKSGTDNIDYDLGIRFLKAAESAITNDKKGTAKTQFCEFLAHDFDSLFRSYEEYSRLLDKSANGKESLSKKEMDDLKEEAKTNPIKALLLEALEKQKEGKQEKLKPFEWLKKVGVITWDQKDPLYQVLEEISKLEDVTRDGKPTSRLEVLLRVTTGKEAELYGQMTARAKGGTDMSQYLTMMTSEMGDVYGFDVLCKTYMAVSDSFTRWTGDEAVGSVVTLQEEAKGTEWIELQKEALKNGKKVKLSPNAARQLISLQVIDTISAQTDRHGRNFKCDYVEQGGEYIVKSIKAYDHDMSFSEVTLDKAYEEDKDNSGKIRKLKKNGFLPPMIQKISTSSPLYRHIRRNYLGKEPDHGWMSKVKTATYMKTQYNQGGGQKEEVPIPMLAKDSLLTVFYKSSLSFFEMDNKITPLKSYYSVVNEPKDIFENIKRYQFEGNFISKRNGEGEIKLDKKLFYAKPEWVKDLQKKNELDGMHYEEFSEKIDKETAESLNIKEAKPEEVEAVKAIWKLSRIISELGRLMIPKAEGGKEYQYAGEKLLYGDEYNLFRSSYVLKRTFKADGIITYTEDEKWRIIELGKQLKELNEKWDFTGLHINGNVAGSTFFQGKTRYAREKYGFRTTKRDNVTGQYDTDPQMGYFDGYIQSTLEYISTMFKDDPVMNKMNEPVPEELQEFYDEESGTIQLPSVLHMDIEDYHRVENIVNDCNNNVLQARMQARQLSQKSIDATVSRARETLEQIKKMKDMAEKLLRYKYPELWEANKNLPSDKWDPRLRFFLNTEEFEKIDDLSDLAPNPGDTYLVQDDDDYMSTQKSFKDCMTISEQNDAKDRRKKAYMDQKRWMGTDSPKEKFKSDGSAVDMKLGKIENPVPAA